MFYVYYFIFCLNNWGVIFVVDSVCESNYEYYGIKNLRIYFVLW